LANSCFFNSTHPDQFIQSKAYNHSPKQITITVDLVTGCSRFYAHLTHIPLEPETRQKLTFYVSLMFIWYLFIFHAQNQAEWSQSKTNLFNL